jgi:hypothetical protein
MRGREQSFDLISNLDTADELTTTRNKDLGGELFVSRIVVPGHIKKLLIWERLKVKADGMALCVYNSWLHVV